MGTHPARRSLSAFVVTALLSSQVLLATPAPAAACTPGDVLGYSTAADWRVGGAAFGRSVLKGSILYAPSVTGIAVWDVSAETTPTLLSEVDLGGPATEVSVEGTRACAVGSFGGMKLIDVSDPAGPSAVATFMPGTRGLAVAVRGDTAFVSLEGHGLKAADISDPANPAYLDHVVPEPGYASFGEIRFRDDVAYVLEKGPEGGSDAIAAIDIKDPAAMALLGSWASAGTITAFGACTSSGSPSVLAAEAGAGWRFVDFSAPDAPVAPNDARPDAGTALTDVAMADARVLFTDAVAGLSVWSLDEGEPYDLLGASGMGQTPVNGITVDGDVAVLGEPGGFGVLTGIAGTKPLPIEERCSYETVPGGVLDAAVAGDHLYCFDPDRGLVVVNVAGDEPDTVFAQVGLGSSTASLDATGTRAVVGTGTQLRVFSTDDPTAPVLLGTGVTSGEVADVSICGDQAYVAERNGTLEVFDISGAPTLTGTWAGASLPAGAIAALNGVWVQDGYAYVAAGPGSTFYSAGDVAPATWTPEGEVIVLALGTGDPTEVARFTTIGAAVSVCGRDGRLYVGTNQKLQIADVSEPSAAHVVGAYLYFAYPLRGVAVDPEGSTVWAATDNGLFAVDVTDPGAPYAMGNFGGTGFATLNVAMSGDLAVVSAGGQGAAGVRVLAERRAGTTRYGTSAELSRKTFMKSDAVVLATGTTYADAVCGAPLARALKGSMLLTGRDKLPAEVKAEIVRLGATKAYVLGGEGAVGSAVVRELEGMGLTVERIAGSNRYDTSRLVTLELAKVLGVTTFEKAYVASGADFPDALSASGVAALEGVPMVLTAPKYVPAPTHAALDAIGNPPTVVIGGSGAVSAGVFTQVGGSVRLGGASRFDTAVRVGTYALANVPGFEPANVIATTGTGFADALAAGVVSAEKGAPVVLTSSVLPAATRAYFDAHPGEVHNALIVGGTGAVSPDVAVAIARYLR
jgi:putative cell wall-binding protein